MQKNLIKLIALISLLNGCAASPTLPTIRKSDVIEIVMGSHLPTNETIDINNESFNNNLNTGAKSGVLAGSLWGLTCGPLAILCVPLGALMGGVTGTATGAVIGLTGALSTEKTRLLRERLLRVQQKHGMLDELQSNVTERAKKNWTINPSQSVAIVSIVLQELQLNSTRDEQISMVIRVQVDVRPKNGPQIEAPTQKMYSYIGPPSSLSIWLDEGNDFIDTNLTSASQQIAAQIIADLTVR